MGKEERLQIEFCFISEVNIVEHPEKEETIIFKGHLPPDRDAVLMIWKRAEPTTTKRKNPMTIGPTEVP